MTEDQIEPLCRRLIEGIRDDRHEEIVEAGIALLVGFLTDINRLAWFTQQLAAQGEAKS